MIHQGWNSDTEPLENSASDMMGLGRVGLELVRRSRVDMVL